MGYPLSMPNMKAEAAQPGTLNRGRMSGSKNLPIILDTLVLVKISHVTKKGNTEGNTMLNHRFMPVIEEDMASLEYTTRRMIKDAHIMPVSSKYSAPDLNALNANRSMNMIDSSNNVLGPLKKYHNILY